jgi:hypothetical protein
MFVPVSGPGGAGEYFRSLAIARGVSERWPDAQVRFVINRNASYAAQCPYPTLLIDDSPTRDVAPVVEIICRERPDAVVFDSAGRVSQLKAAAKVGAVRVYLSSRPKTRWKGFKLSRLHWLDEHWIASPDFIGKGLTLLERLKLHLVPRVRVRFLPTFYEEPTEALVGQVLARYGLQRDQFVLCCPGGAGTFSGIKSGAQVFADAAASIAEGSGLRVVLVGGPIGVSAPNVESISALPNAELMALAGSARLCVINGGSLLVQCLSRHAACVCAPIAGDQASRISACAQAGLIEPADFTSESLTRAALALCADAARTYQLRSAAAELGIKNGVATAVDALDALLERRATVAQAKTKADFAR